MLKQSFVQEKLSDLASADSAIFKSRTASNQQPAASGRSTDRSSREVNAALRFNLKASPVDLNDVLNEHFPESSQAVSDYYYKNNIKFIQAQHQDVLKGLQEELELTKEKNRSECRAASN